MHCALFITLVPAISKTEVQQTYSRDKVMTVSYPHYWLCNQKKDTYARMANASSQPFCCHQKGNHQL